MIKRMINYVKNQELRIIYVNNSVDVVNYDKILEVSDEIVILLKANKLIYIRGKELKLNKLLDEEILISGIITKIEL